MVWHQYSFSAQWNKWLLYGSGGFRGGSWSSMEPSFGLDLVTDDRLNGTPLSSYRTKNTAVLQQKIQSKTDRLDW